MPHGSASLISVLVYMNVTCSNNKTLSTHTNTHHHTTHRERPKIAFVLCISLSLSLLLTNILAIFFFFIYIYFFFRFGISVIRCSAQFKVFSIRWFKRYVYVSTFVRKRKKKKKKRSWFAVSVTHFNVNSKRIHRYKYHTNKIVCGCLWMCSHKADVHFEIKLNCFLDNLKTHLPRKRAWLS